MQNLIKTLQNDIAAKSREVRLYPADSLCWIIVDAVMNIIPDKWNAQ